jgi:hypothetical protein
MARKHRSKALFQKTGLVPMSAAKAKRQLRNARCVLIGGDEGASTFQCGKRVITHDHVNDHYYRVTGATAMGVGYDLKRRNAGYTPKRKHSYKGHR